MSGMEIDSPPEFGSVPPRDRVLQRLALLGVPLEELSELPLGLVCYAKENKSRIPELVSAILPTDLDAEEILSKAKSQSDKASFGTSLGDIFRESMFWLQWLMFEGEPGAALRDLSRKSIGSRGVCGAVWGKNDLAYRCQTCEHDPTCAICVPCFQNGNHKDHDYSIIYTCGGCCDCGDVTAWKREGFCSKHTGAAQIQPLSEDYANSVGPVLDTLLICWKNKLLFAETISQDLGGTTRFAERRGVANELTFVVVEMLLEFCQYSESLLSFVSKRVFSSVGLLDILVRAESFLGKDVVRKLHELLLKLLGEPVFKYEFAKVFLNYYPHVINDVVKACRDVTLKKHPLLSIFSVQIFTVQTLTSCLVTEMNLLAMLLGCLRNIFISCAGGDGRLQVAKWEKLYEITFRVVEDIRFVMSHDVVPKYVIRNQREILRTWMTLLAFVQGMHPLKRETGIHIEDDNENIPLPFSLDLSMANIHSLLAAGAVSVCSSEESGEEACLNTYKQDLDNDSIRHAKIGRLSQESSACSAAGSRALDFASKGAEMKSDTAHPLLPSSVKWLIFECLRAIENWFGVDKGLLNVLSPNSNMGSGNFLAFKKTLSKIRKGRCILSRLTTSSEGHSIKYSSSYSGSLMNVDTEDGPSTGEESKSIVAGEVDKDNASKHMVFDGNAMECGGCITELDALRVLSLSDWPDITYDVSSQDISIHIPLHRLLALLLQKAVGKCYGETALLDNSSATHTEFFRHVLGGCHPFGFSAFVMEHPLRNRVFCAEVHAGMWRKNGDSALLSCGWYRSVRWGGQDYELDLFLLQFCAALAPADLFVNRILERFGLSDYLSLRLECSSEYEPVLVQEMLTLLIQIVKERRFCGLTITESLRRELVYKLAIGDATHSQLVKFLPRDLSESNQLQEILDTVAQYSNPSGLNQGMYSLRWAYWKELDLYHPRWNSRDLQVAEERYLRFCSVSPLITQLPKWTKIYPPLKGVARIATCKTVLLVVRSVLYYAVFTDMNESRAPDLVLLPALHLLALALDICFLQKFSSDFSCEIEDAIPLLAFADEEIGGGVHNRSSGQSLLSLLVSLMRLHKNEDANNYMESGNCNLSSLICELLKKFAEIDTGCMAKLETLAPEVANHLTNSNTKISTNVSGSASDAEKRKARARERQAAILEKMKVEQSKFLKSFKSGSDDELNGSESTQKECNSDFEHDSELSARDVCSLCHDPSSRSPLSFLILLQKSRLSSFIDRGYISWEQAPLSDKLHFPINTNRVTHQYGMNISSGSSEMVLPSELVRDAMNEFTHEVQPVEVDDFLEFIKAHYPASGNIQDPCRSNVSRDGTEYSFETLEEDIYFFIRREMLNDLNIAEDDKKFPTAVAGSQIRSVAEFVVLGKYIAVLSKETTEKPIASKGSFKHNDDAPSEFTAQIPAYGGFGPADSDGIHISSCGHAVHQGCLDRYLSSLKERYSRRIAFEGGHIVDPDKGEFLCPVCRRLTNSILPMLPGASWKGCKQSKMSDASLPHVTSSLFTSNKGDHFLYILQALSLLRSAANVISKGETYKAFSMWRTGRICPNLEPFFLVLCGLYFTGKQDKLSRSPRVSQSMIMWDTLKYSLISMEIAARSERSYMTSKYGSDVLYKGLESSSGFILSLLLQVVQCVRNKNSLHVLQRFRGIQLFAESICSGASADGFPSDTCRQGGKSLPFLEHAGRDVPYPDIQFWKQASDPILAHDPFSSLMWVLFCLPYPFLSCEESFLCLVHLFYVVSVTQAIITYCGKYQCLVEEMGFHDSLIFDIYNVMGKVGVTHQYFASNYINPSSNIEDVIRSLSVPYLRRCALLWKLLNSSISEPFSDVASALDVPTSSISEMMDSCAVFELPEVEKLENMFKIPPLAVVLKDELLRSLALKWYHHFCKEFEIRNSQFILYSTPAVPFKLMHLPHVYQDLLERYIKRWCSECEPALCLLCGTLCSASLKSCCRERGCQSHAMACGAGTGVFLLIRRTTILLQRSARRAPWPSPYLDAFGEEVCSFNNCC